MYLPQARHAELRRASRFDPHEELAYVPMGQARYISRISPVYLPCISRISPHEELAYVPMGQAR